jgi:hypothetical protein
MGLGRFRDRHEGRQPSVNRAVGQLRGGFRTRTSPVWRHGLFGPGPFPGNGWFPVAGTRGCSWFTEGRTAAFRDIIKQQGEKVTAGERFGGARGGRRLERAGPGRSISSRFGGKAESGGSPAASGRWATWRRATGCLRRGVSLVYQRRSSVLGKHGMPAETGGRRFLAGVAGEPRVCARGGMADTPDLGFAPCGFREATCRFL